MGILYSTPSILPPFFDGALRAVALFITNSNEIILLFARYVFPRLVSPSDLRPLTLPNAIQFRTEQPYLRRTYHYAVVCARYTPGVHRWFPDIHENSRVWGRQRESLEGEGEARGEGVWCTCSGFDFQPTIRYCQLFSVHVGPLWICREMAVDYCIRSGAVMSICIMHRLNKRVAVLSDVVEHDGGVGRVRAPPAKQLLTGGEFSTPFT